MVRATPIPPQPVASQSRGHEQFDGVSNRRDDDLGPVELPDRTDQIVRQRGWKQARRSANREGPHSARSDALGPLVDPPGVVRRRQGGRVTWEGACTLRDLGGLPLAARGVSAYGRIWRSGSPDEMPANSWSQATTDGLTTVVDLRSVLGRLSTCIPQRPRVIAPERCLGIGLISRQDRERHG
jgi:hypothetical protein